MSSAMFLLLLIAAIYCAAVVAVVTVDITFIQGAVEKGAVCMDGSPAAYHMHSGFGSGADNWVIFLEGGGWCRDSESCLQSLNFPTGSSKKMGSSFDFAGILSDEVEENPDFFNWNRILVRYCDGGSFAGDNENKTARLHFRGQRIWVALMDELLSKGMRHANQALLSGCSSGGLASILHCDGFASLFSTRTKVKCLADGGLFFDVADVSGGHIIRRIFHDVVRLQAAQKNLPRTCIDHLDAASCFMPQNLINHIKTPLFIVNPAYDSAQILLFIAPDEVDPNGHWKNCKLNHNKCSGSQMQLLQDFRNKMLDVVKPFGAVRQNGLFINSCFSHCQTLNWKGMTWFGVGSPVINNKTIADAVGDWYFDRSTSKEIECAYPSCGKFCHNDIFEIR